MQNIINIIVFLLVLSSIIIIHELGHFIAAKYFGVYCSQFSLGMGPKLWSKKGKETEYELRALPIGGFVAMAGEQDQLDNDELKDVPYERTLQGIKTYQKVVIFLAGVFMNFVLTIVIIFGINVTSGQLPVNVAQIGAVIEGSAAEKYGLQKDDIIQSIVVQESGETLLVSNFSDMHLDKKIAKTNSDTISLQITVERNKVKKVIPVKVNYNEKEERYTIGVQQATRDMTFIESIQYTFTTFGSMSVAIIGALGQLITNFSGTISQMSGPAGIYQITAEVTSTGQFVNILSLLAMLSVNVGIFNLMPIPGLDGCQVLFALVEKIIGRELPDNLKMGLQIVGMGLVFLLMIVVTYQDIIRLME